MRLFIISIALLVIAAGCLGQSSLETKENLEITLTADPADIHYTEPLALFIDMENKGDTDFARLDYNLFDTGLLVCSGCSAGGACSGFVENIRPGEIVSLECALSLSPDIPLVQPVSSTEIKFKAITQNALRNTIVAEMLSQDEWRRQLTTGTLEQKSASFAIKDNNLQMRIDFTKPLPFVESPAGEKILFTIKVSNVGSGFIDELNPEQLKIEPSGGLVACDFPRRIVPFNGEFPPVFCEFSVNAGSQASASYPVTFSLDYSYEVRKSVGVTVRR